MWEEETEILSRANEGEGWEWLEKRIRDRLEDVGKAGKVGKV